MKYQSYNYSCGSCSIVNALRMFGMNFSEKTIRKYANTNKQDGTSEENMVKAIVDLGFSVNAIEKTSFNECWTWLVERLKNGNPVILSVSNWTHYVTAIALFGGNGESPERVIIFDPAKQHKRVKNENGVFVLNQKQMKRLWFNKKEGLCHGLAIVP